jgi:hypothetical protein
MLFTKQEAFKLEALLSADVEEAIILMLNIILKQIEEDVDYNPNASDVELRQLQGKKLLIKDLKDYRQRLIDATKG